MTVSKLAVIGVVFLAGCFGPPNRPNEISETGPKTAKVEPQTAAIAPVDPELEKIRDELKEANKIKIGKSGRPSAPPDSAKIKEAEDAIARREAELLTQKLAAEKAVADKKAAEEANRGAAIAKAERDRKAVAEAQAAAAEAQAAEARSRKLAEAQESAQRAKEEYEEDGLVLLRKTVQTEQGRLTKITGSIVNRSGKDLRYASVKYNLYDESGALVGNAIDTVTGLEDGATWKFEATAFKEFSKYRVDRLTGR